MAAPVPRPAMAPMIAPARGGDDGASLADRDRPRGRLRSWVWMGKKLSIGKGKFAELQTELRSVVIRAIGFLGMRDATENGLSTEGHDPAVNHDGLRQVALKSVTDDITIGGEPLVGAHLNHGASGKNEGRRNLLRRRHRVLRQCALWRAHRAGRTRRVEEQCPDCSRDFRDSGPSYCRAACWTAVRSQWDSLACFRTAEQQQVR